VTEHIPCARSDNGTSQPQQAAATELSESAPHDARRPVSEETFAHPFGRLNTRLVAVIPAYNEDWFIGSVVLKAHPFVDRIIVVDDGSTD